MGNGNLIVPPILSKIHHKLEHHACQSYRAPVKSILLGIALLVPGKIQDEEGRTRASMQAVTPDPQVTTMGWSREIPEETANKVTILLLLGKLFCTCIIYPQEKKTQFLSDLQC